jgi:CxxC motif-containing protein
MTGAAGHGITHYLCIGCPLGCRLEVETDEEGDVVEVRGFACRKGKVFGEREHVDPRRLVATTVAVDGGRWPRLPVHVTDPIPKGRVVELCRTLRAVRVRAPVRLGQVIARDPLGTGVDVVASRDMPEAEPIAG